MSDHGLKTVEDVLDQAVGFWRSGILQAALDLHVADHIVAGHTTAEEVASAAEADPRAMRILMDALCGLGFMDKVDGHYRLEPLVEQILPILGRTAPLSLDKDAMATWTRLSDAVRLGFPLGAKDNYWERFAQTTREVARFQGAMAAQLVGDGGTVPKRVLDVGAGSGEIGFGLALADPSVTVTALDTESVLEIAGTNARELGIADRVTLRALDLVEAESFGAAEFDVAIVANILHLFDAATNRALLHKVAAALVPGGQILIHEIMPDDERRRAAYPLMFAVELLLRTPAGTVYTLPEISAWLSEAEFSRPEVLSAMAYVVTLTAAKRR